MFVFSIVHVRIASPAGWQDIVMVSDGQFRSCYSVLRQSRMKIVWQWSSTCSTVTLHVHELWLTPSLKQSHYKLDMTSVTPTIITGQDSWPLPVMVHVVIRSNTTHWFSAEPTSESCFIMLSVVIGAEVFFCPVAENGLQSVFPQQGVMSQTISFLSSSVYNKSSFWKSQFYLFVLKTINVSFDESDRESMGPSTEFG